MCSLLLWSRLIASPDQPNTLNETNKIDSTISFFMDDLLGSGCCLQPGGTIRAKKRPEDRPCLRFVRVGCQYALEPLLITCKSAVPVDVGRTTLPPDSATVCHPSVLTPGNVSLKRIK